MHIVDLSHPITPDMPVYPGTEPPTIATGCTIEQQGFEEKKITLFSHTGTHVDAPAHLLTGGKTLDEFPARFFVGQALRIDVREAVGCIEKDRLTPHEKDLHRVDFLLLQTGWSRYWGDRAYFAGYPVLTTEAAQWLAGLGLKGVGLDAISADREGSRELPVHRILLQQGMVIVENLNNLQALPSDRVVFSCLPLPTARADGSPVRAVAWPA